MTATITSAKLDTGLQIKASNPDSLAIISKLWDAKIELDFKTSGSYFFDSLFSAESKDLTSASSVDIDIYDLGTYDLGNGAGYDNLGFTHANATIHFMFIRNLSTSTGNLVVDPSVANGWTAWLPSGTHTLAPGAMIFGYWPAGLTVTDASSHIVRITASGGDITYDFQFLSTHT